MFTMGLGRLLGALRALFSVTRVHGRIDAQAAAVPTHAAPTLDNAVATLDVNTVIHAVSTSASIEILGGVQFRVLGSREHLQVAGLDASGVAAPMMNLHAFGNVAECSSPDDAVDVFSSPLDIRGSGGATEFETSAGGPYCAGCEVFDLSHDWEYTQSAGGM